MNSLTGLVSVYLSNLLVEPMKSARSRRLSMHSGWAITSAKGCLIFSFNSASSLNASCTRQVPGDGMEIVHRDTGVVGAAISPKPKLYR